MQAPPPPAAATHAFSLVVVSAASDTAEQAAKCIATQVDPVPLSTATMPSSPTTTCAPPVDEINVMSPTVSIFASAAASMFTSAPAVRYASCDAELSRSSFPAPPAEIETLLSAVVMRTDDHVTVQTLELPPPCSARQACSVCASPAAAQASVCVAAQLSATAGVAPGSAAVYVQAPPPPPAPSHAASFSVAVPVSATAEQAAAAAGKQATTTASPSCSIDTPPFPLTDTMPPDTSFLTFSPDVSSPLGVPTVSDITCGDCIDTPADPDDTETAAPVTVTSLSSTSTRTTPEPSRS